MEAITYNIMAERAIRDLSGGDIPNDSPYDIDFAKQHARDGMSIHLKLELLRRRNGDEDDRSGAQTCIATYRNIQVKLESDTNRAYAELPDTFISIKHNKGIHSASKMTGTLKPFKRVENPGTFSALAAANIPGEVWYYVEGMRIYFLRNILQDKINKILIKLITAASSNFGDDDALPIIPETVGDILTYIKSQMMNRTVQDRLADNNPNLRQLNEQQK